MYRAIRKGISSEATERDAMHRRHQALTLNDGLRKQAKTPEGINVWWNSTIQPGLGNRTPMQAWSARETAQRHVTRGQPVLSLAHDLVLVGYRWSVPVAWPSRWLRSSRCSACASQYARGVTPKRVRNSLMKCETLA